MMLRWIAAIAIVRTDGPPALAVLHAGWRGLAAGIAAASAVMGAVCYASSRLVHAATGAGKLAQIADAAMGMSLATLQEDGLWNTTIELKINFLRPVVSGRLRAVGRVVEMKQTLLFSEADVLDEKGRLVARASSTCMPVPEGQGRE